MDVFEQTDEAVHQRHAQRPKQVVPAGLHVLRCSPLGHILAADVLVVGCHHIGDEIIIPTGGLEGGTGQLCEPPVYTETAEHLN